MQIIVAQIIVLRGLEKVNYTRCRKKFSLQKEKIKNIYIMEDVWIKLHKNHDRNKIKRILTSQHVTFRRIVSRR